MSYTTYEFYESTYLGDSIASADFAKWESRAQAKLDYLTENRITEEMFEDDSLGNKIKMAECAIAEILYNIDKATKASGVSDTGEGKIIKSRSSGSESISYDTGNDIYTKAAGDFGAINKMCINRIKEYLFDTGLLYRGVTPCTKKQ